MSHRVVVNNLPPETTADELKAAFAERGIEVEIILHHEGNPDKVTAIVELPDMDRVTADRLAQRIDGMEYKGRQLKAYVPLFL